MAGLPVVLHHDETKPIGIVASETSNDDGLDVSAKISTVAAGDEALVLAADGVLRGFSVGIEPTKYRYEYADDSETLVVEESTGRHLALVVSPAFEEATVSRVAARERGSFARKDETVTDTKAEPKPDPVNASDKPAEPVKPEPVAALPRTPLLVRAGIPKLGDYLFAHASGDTATLAKMRAAIMAASPDTIVSDLPGIVPTPIVGSAVSLRDASRPVVTALGPQAGPAGASFTRPVISNPLADAAAVAELATAADTLGVTDVTFTYSYVKRSVRVSAETIAFTSPAVLGVVGQDLADAYARGTEQIAATALAAVDAGPTDISADIEAGLYAAAGAIYAACGELPDTLFVGTAAWTALGSLKATDGRPAFPVLAPANASGTSAGVTSFALNVLGLRVVVSWALPASGAYLAATSKVEAYETPRINMQAEEPTVLGMAIGIGGGIAVAPLTPGAVSNLDVIAGVA